MGCIVQPASFLEDFPFLSFLRWRCANPRLLIGVAAHARPLHGRKWSHSGPGAAGEAGAMRTMGSLGRLGGDGNLPCFPPLAWGEPRTRKNVRLWQPRDPHQIALRPDKPRGSWPALLPEKPGLFGAFSAAEKQRCPSASGWWPWIFGPRSSGCGQDWDLEVGSQRKEVWGRPCASPTTAGAASFRRHRPQPQWACRSPLALGGGMERGSPVARLCDRPSDPVSCSTSFLQTAATLSASAHLAAGMPH